MVMNPFAMLDDPPEKAAAQEEPKDRLPDVPRGAAFVYDLETVPDESRFQRPVEPEKVEKPDADIDLQSLVAGTIPQITAKISILSDWQLRSLADLEGMGKNRAGVIKAIDEQLQSGGSDYPAQLAEWKRLAINPFCCKVVALGVRSKDWSLTLTAKNEEEERRLIATLWKCVDHFAMRVGYNINSYDDMVLAARSMLLKIDPSKRLDRRKFNNKQSIDLMTTLFPSGTAQKLKDVCRYLGIVPPAGYEMDGSQVLDLVDAGEWDKVAEYVASDAMVEWQLFQMLGDYLVF